MADETLWARVVIVAQNGDRLVVVLAGPDHPDLAAVDELARLWLQARRAGCRVQLCHLAPALRGLLDLTGLLGEVGGETEGGE
jgi:anti-anti-sigma regulatory factor